MAGVAFLLKRQGYRITGCDGTASARTRWLEEHGIPVALGHSPDHLAGVDQLVVTPAVPPHDPERQHARATCTVRMRGEVLADLVNAADGIAVCGTHGKTTTATFTTRLLRLLGADPSWCIGGETGTMPVAGTGQGPLVVEADESDGTLALYRPATLVLTSVDFDHLEHFPSPDAYFDCYRTVLRQTTRTCLVCADHPRACALAREAAAVPLVTYGFDDQADVRAADWPDLPRLVRGRHNLLNALAAIAVALSRGYTREAIAAALPRALDALPDRRFQTLVQTPDNIHVVTDYAHHPAELACAVNMAAACSPTRLRVLFQPHRYSRTKALLRDFPPAFSRADEVVLIPVYPAFEDPIPGGDIADLYQAFRQAAPLARVLLARDAQEAWRHVFLSAESGDLILLAGAGDIINLAPTIRSDLSALRPPPTRSPRPLAPLSFFRTGGLTTGGGERSVIGQGSNTWFSDCTTDLEIIRAPVTAEDGLVPAGLPGASLLADHPELAFMAGIPGTVGGWAKMNAGAFGDAFGSHIDYVVADGRIIPHDACGFAYRTSKIPGCITAVALQPARGVTDKTASDFLARRKTFPPRTCGSVFKNPCPDQPAGRLLEEAGAKTLSVGGAAVWRDHANVIVAGEGCTSSDILALARLMARAVFFRTGVRLEPEIRNLAVW